MKNDEEFFSDSSDEESSRTLVRTTAPKFQLKGKSKAFMNRGSTFNLESRSTFQQISINTF